MVRREIEKLGNVAREFLSRTVVLALPHVHHAPDDKRVRLPRRNNRTAVFHCVLPAGKRFLAK